MLQCLGAGSIREPPVSDSWILSCRKTSLIVEALTQVLAPEHLSSLIYLMAAQTRNQPFCCLKVNPASLSQVLVPLDLASWVDSELVCLVCRLCAPFPAGGAVLFPMPTRHTLGSTRDMTVKVQTVPAPHIVRVV